MEIKQMKQCFLSQKGPRAIGPYSTATIHGGVCYLSGMLPVIPETGKLAEGGAAAPFLCAFAASKAFGAAFAAPCSALSSWRKRT